MPEHTWTLTSKPSANHVEFTKGVDPAVPEDQAEASELRAPLVLLRAIAMLHKRGLQGLRILPYLHDNGFWRCIVYVPKPGERYTDHDVVFRADALLTYTNASGYDYFNERRAEPWTPYELADRLERNARAYQYADRVDAAYAAWYADLLVECGVGVPYREQGRFVILRGPGEIRPPSSRFRPPPE